MPRRRSSKEETLTHPQFASREEEAAWYDANRARLMDDLFRYGKAVPARIVEKTQQLTMRIPVADIERARDIGRKQGVGYQSVLKKAIRDGLKAAS